MSESAVKAKRRFFGVVTSPREALDHDVREHEGQAREDAGAEKRRDPEVGCGKQDGAAAAAMTESREASIGARGPERSSQRPAAIARNMGPNEIEASMRPTSKDEAPA